MLSREMLRNSLKLKQGLQSMLVKEKLSVLTDKPMTTAEVAEHNQAVAYGALDRTGH